MTSSEEREPLSRERVLAGAAALADTAGIGALTMRSLATALGVRPMALYHYVATKDEILDGLVDLVFAEIELPREGGEWREEMGRRARSARAALRRHPWAVFLLESRTNAGHATLRHHDAVLGALRGGGFSLPQAAHAYALLDSFVYGFAVQESTLPFSGPEEAAEVVTAMAAAFSDGAYPHLTEMATQHVLAPGYDFGDEFEIGLGLVLDALARLREAD